ncbi:TPA: hypothetical protein DIU27_04475 [Candidatus Collierbacteria bacterium]|nr:hypothetical protein [Candidatus Collierbacteria bacterium]
MISTAKVRSFVLYLVFSLLFFFSASTPTHAAPNILNIITTVVNDSGNTWNPSDFSVSVKKDGQNVSGSPSPGTASPGKRYTLEAGSYVVIAGPYEKYSSSYGGDCSSDGQISLSSNENKTCLITTNDIPPRLNVIVSVINDNGGTLSASNFTIHVKVGGADLAGSPTSGKDSPGTLFELNRGTFIVSEDVNRLYTQSFSGDCDTNGNVTLSIGDIKTCIIVNDDNASTIPLFPNTGGTSNTEPIFCFNRNNLTWIFATIILGFMGYLNFRPHTKSTKKVP